MTLSTSPKTLKISVRILKVLPASSFLSIVIMPVVRVFDKNGNCIKVIGLTRNVPEDIVSMEIENDSGVLGDDDAKTLDYSTLSRIFSRFSKGRLLTIARFFAQLGCLVAGLAQPGELQELQMSFITPHNRDLNNHLLLLLRGIAFASSLEKLHLLFRYRLVALRPALMDAILMNGTLK
jgi:hypothetical protein